MNRFEWTDDLATGNDAIDAQHKTLFALADALQDEIEAESPDDAAVGECVWELTDYVMQHFADEQEMMATAGFPGLTVHTGMHDSLTAETMQLTARIMRGEIVASAEVAPLVTRWMRDHILNSDMEFAHYLARHR